MKIPTYESSNGIKTGNTPELNLSSVNASKQAGQGLSEAIANVGKNFAEVEEARGKVRDFRQTNEAQAYAFDKLNAIKALADEDVDFDPARYEEEITKVGQEAGKTITSPLAKEEFMANFQRQATTTSWGIKNLFRTRELEAAKASIEYNRQQLVNSYAGMSHAEQITAVANFKKSLMSGVKTGIYNQATANQIDMNLQKDVQESVVNTHIIANPEITKTELEKGKDGSYPGISEEFRAESITKADAYDKKYKAEAEAKQKELIDTNENNIVTRMIDPQKQKPTEGEIVTMMNSNNPEERISPRFAKAVIENIRSAKKYKPDDKGTEFESIISDMINPKKDPKETLIKIMSANTSGKISDDDFNNLSLFAQSITTKELDQALPKQKHLWGLISWGKDVNLRPVIKNQMLKYYLKQVNNNVAPEVAIKDAMKQSIILTHPQAATYSEKGQKLIDLNGSTKKIFPTYELADDGDAD